MTTFELLHIAFFVLWTSTVLFDPRATPPGPKNAKRERKMKEE
jgi:hypothetical protein